MTDRTTMSLGKTVPEAFSIGKLEDEEKKLTTFTENFKLKVSEIKKLSESITKHKAENYTRLNLLGKLNVYKPDDRIKFLEITKEIADAAEAVCVDITAADNLIIEISNKSFDNKDLNEALTKIADSCRDAIEELK